MAVVKSCDLQMGSWCCVDPGSSINMITWDEQGFARAVEMGPAGCSGGCCSLQQQHNGMSLTTHTHPTASLSPVIWQACVRRCGCLGRQWPWIDVLDMETYSWSPWLSAPPSLPNLVSRSIGGDLQGIEREREEHVHVLEITWICSSFLALSILCLCLSFSLFPPSCILLTHTPHFSHTYGARFLSPPTGLSMSGGHLRKQGSMPVPLKTL